MALNYEAITDEGYLNNPYRVYRYLNDPLDPSAGFQQATEVYPNTRTSDAAGVKFLYHLPWRGTLGTGYRYFTDDWGIDAHTGQIGYTHALLAPLHPRPEVPLLRPRPMRISMVTCSSSLTGRERLPGRDKELSEDEQPDGVAVCQLRALKPRIDKGAFTSSGIACTSTTTTSATCGGSHRR